MLNTQQLKAVNSDSRNILCLAGAGTGKTHTMIQRIVKQVKDDNIDPRSILVLTFTNAAAREMKERYLSHNIDSPFTPNFKTFHALCYSLLQNDIKVRTKLGYVKCPDIISDEKFREISTNAYVTLGIKQPKNNKILSIKQQADYELVLKYISKQLIKQNCITFAILCEKVCKLFINNDITIQRYLDQYKYIYVDEFQDTDDIQYQFVCSFKSANKFYVGDALQNLYRFRGTDSSIIKQLAISEDVETIKMNENYRSTKKICDFANKNSKYASDDYRIEINSEKNGVDVKLSHSNTNYYDTVDKNVIDVIVSELQSVTGTSAILVRTNKEVNEIVSQLKQVDIELTITSNSHEISHYNKLKAMIDDDYAIDLLSAYLNNDHYLRYIKEKHLKEAVDSAFSFDTFLLFIDQFKEVESLKEDIVKLRKFYKCSNSLDSLLQNESNLLPKIDKSFNIVEEYVEYFKQLDDITDTTLKNNDVYCGTIHSAKGLEYDNVFLVNVNGKSFRLTNEDNNNLYYVGITRAKNYLHVFLEGGKDE